FTPPLTYGRDQSSGGYVSYVPISYAQSVRVALTNADNGYNSCTGNSYRALWFQFQYHRIPLGTIVTSFNGINDAPALRALLSRAGDDPWEAGLTPVNVDGNIAPSSTIGIGAKTGFGWLRGLRLKLPRDAYSHVSVQLKFDGDVTVDAPL